MGDVSETLIDTVLAIVDRDNSGMIDFDEFLMTAIAPEDMLTIEAISKAFKIFDVDGGGAVSFNEIMEQLSKSGY